MLERARLLLASLLCLCCVACGGGGGDAGSPAMPPPVATTGSLVIAIASLPAASAAAIRVTGPGNYAQDVRQALTLTNLAPGTYTVAAANVVANNVTYSASPPTQTVAVGAGASATVSVVYGASTLALAAVEVATAVSPTFVTAPPDDTRLFVVERAGRIRILQNNVFLTQPFLDISARVLTAGEGGLLSMAFDPRFSTNGYVYLYYVDLNQNIVVERFTVSPNANLADPTSNLPIIRIPHPTFQNHFGGLVAFGPDGMLYLGTGDGGGAGDPARNAQNLNVLLGKMLRLDVSAATPAQPYAIPANNPYVNQAGRRGEIWAAGLRNPWRYAFDSGQLYIADVGQDRREEVDIVPATVGGLNYGWNIAEGTLCYGATACDLGGLTAPAFDYDHGSGNVNGCAITGGAVYRGAALPELNGRYFYSDYCAGFLNSVVASAGGVTEQRAWNIGAVGNVVSFGRDGKGELYLVAGSGRIFRISRAGAPSS